MVQVPLLNIEGVVVLYIVRGVPGKRTKKVEDTAIDAAGHVYTTLQKMRPFHQGEQRRCIKKSIS